MDRALNRRGLIIAAPAAAVAATLPALAQGADPDSGLLALRPLWRKAWQDYDDTFEPLAQAETRHRERRLTKPDREGFVGTDAKFAMAVAIVLQKNEDLAVEVGLSEAQRRQEEAAEAEWDIADQVFAIRARTTEGIRFKLEILKAREACESEDMEPSLRSDLLHMVGIYDA